ncbi:DUF2514 family protein [Citrobacter amalonaticus]|uniref:DUF2514 family protein n=1 Tax=Citrobacter amalonaticus TaxID=35703 RepID=UPI0018B0EDAF|nr:DUF2514 family protein [Citrobacter amalonaticus]
MYERGVASGEANINAKWSVSWAIRNAADTMATLKQEQEERAEERRRQAETEGIIADARHDAIRFEAKYHDAVASGERLQRELRAIRSKFKTSETGRISTTSGGGYTAAEAASLLAELYASADKRAGEIAKFADDANRAGFRCEQIYETVTDTPLQNTKKKESEK